MMTYIIIAIGIIAILYYLFSLYSKKSLMNRMISGVDMVKYGIYRHLRVRLSARYGWEKAGWVAAAVTNDLFSEYPSDIEAEEFLESHRETIEKELFNLQNDDEIRNVVTQAIRVKCTVSYAEGVKTRNSLIDPVEKLMKLGILITGGDAPSPETFLSMAYEFDKSTIEEYRNFQQNI